MSNTTTTTATTRIPAIAVEVSMAEAGSPVTLHHGALTLKFATGDSAQLATVDLSPEILSQALLHGLKQKLVDAAAIARNTETGASATVQDKKEAVLAVLDRLMEGEWNKTREGGDSATKGNLLILALGRMNPAGDMVQLSERVKAMTDEQRAALSKNPKVLVHIQAIQAERAAAKAKTSGVDSDALLGVLLGGK